MACLKPPSEMNHAATGFGTTSACLFLGTQGRAKSFAIMDAVETETEPNWHAYEPSRGHVDIWIDGGTLGSNPSDKGVYWSVYGIDECGIEFLERVERYDYHTNNEAEYLALIDALRSLRDRNYISARIHCDSKLVVNQVNGRWKLRGDGKNLTHLKGLACYLLEMGGCSVDLVWVPRAENVKKLGH